MTLTLGGKPIAPKQMPLRDGKHKLVTQEQIFRRQSTDPFPPIETFAAETVAHRHSVACDLFGWVEQILSDMAPLADDENWLRLQLREPAFLEHPDRPDALQRLHTMHDQLAQYASDIAYLEAHVDRIWQSLDEADRKPLAGNWVASVTDERLILNAWKHVAPVGYRWPDYYHVQYAWFDQMSPALLHDIKAAWPQAGLPLGRIHEWETEDEASNT